MDIRIILADKSYAKDAEQARLFLAIFGLSWTVETRPVDISKPALYETKASSTKSSVTSLRTDWVLSLASETCVAVVVPKRKSLQMGLNGQQGTLGDRYAVEVYADGRKGHDGLSGTAVTICHEVMHALSEYHGVKDTLHKDLNSNKTITECRELLLDRVLVKYGTLGLLPALYPLIGKIKDFAQSVGTPIKILEGYRSPQRQDELYRKKPKVTNAKAWQSMHQYRIAFDYCFTDRPNFPPSGDPKWNAVNSYAKKIGLYSYGLDEKFDDGHLELLFDYSEKQVMSRDMDWTRYWNAPVSLKFSRDLKLGMRGEDVIELQRYLNHRGFTVAKEGAGSPGKETDYFGPKTKAALARFQKSHGISPANGYLGPITRNYIG